MGEAIGITPGKARRIGIFERFCARVSAAKHGKAKS
jgi:hypothetical protein